MKKKDSKIYYEKRAQLTLIYNFSSSIYSTEIKLQDRPDLYDSINNVGIEVTRSFYDNDAEISSLGTKCTNKHIAQVDENRMKYIKSLEGELFEIDQYIYGCCFPAHWVTSTVIKNSYIKKIKKLNQGHYRSCTHYDLYIYSPGFDEFEENHINNFMSEILKIQKNYNKRFRNVYIDDETVIYICNCYNNTINKHFVDKGKLHNICVESKNYVNM